MLIVVLFVISISQEHCQCEDLILDCAAEDHGCFQNIYRDGCGNISFKLLSKSRIPFFASWPSVRPWFFSNPQPTFRCIADVEIIALKLSEAAQSRISEINLSNSNAIKNVNIQDGGITA